MRFREHGMNKPTINVEGKAGVVDYLRSGLAHWPDLDHLDPANIQSEHLGVEISLNANSHAWWRDWPEFHLVTLPGYGVVGYTDAPLEAADARDSQAAPGAADLGADPDHAGDRDPRG